jgi:hypothetical protein
MASSAIDWDSVKRAVLDAIAQEALRPTALLDALGDRYPDVVIKEGVLRLLQEQRITMTADQQLASVGRAA